MEKGRDLLLHLDGQPMACSTGCEFDSNTEFIEVCSPVSGNDKQYLPTLNGWGLSAQYLCASMADAQKLVQEQRAHQLFGVTFYSRDGSMKMEGSTYLRSIRITGDVNGLARMAVAFQPTGALSYTSPTPSKLDYTLIASPFLFTISADGKGFSYTPIVSIVNFEVHGRGDSNTGAISTEEGIVTYYSYEGFAGVGQSLFITINRNNVEISAPNMLDGVKVKVTFTVKWQMDGTRKQYVFSNISVVQ